MPDPAGVERTELKKKLSKIALMEANSHERTAGPDSLWNDTHRLRIFLLKFFRQEK